MSKEGLRDNQEEKVLGGNGPEQNGGGRHCSLGIEHFYKNYVMSPVGFKSAEHCSQFSVRELSEEENLIVGKSKTGCNFCKYYVE